MLCRAGRPPPVLPPCPGRWVVFCATQLPLVGSAAGSLLGFVPVPVLTDLHHQSSPTPKEPEIEIFFWGGPVSGRGR